MPIVRTRRLPKITSANVHQPVRGAKNSAMIRPILTSDISQGPKQGRYGCLESADAAGICGWVIDLESTSTPVTVLILLDEVEIFRGTADRPRPDVSVILDAGANCGFAFSWKDIAPVGPLPELELRKGELLATTEAGEVLTRLFVLDSTNIYKLADQYWQRQLLAHSLTDLADFHESSKTSDEEYVRKYFNSDFYAKWYPDSCVTEKDALDHFMTVGWKNGRDPNATFSCAYYLQANKDVRDSGMNPYVHYLRNGKQEGRLPRSPCGMQLSLLSNQVSLDDRVAGWRRSDSARAQTAAHLIRTITSQPPTARNLGWILSFSHDDYTSNVGGIQLCVAKEQLDFNKAGYNYLHISPWQPSPILFSAPNHLKCPLRLILNGSAIGYTNGAELLKLGELLFRPATSTPNWLVIHALHGHAPELILELQRITSPIRSYFWLHDYFTICEGYNLLRNDVTYCGAPVVSSIACGICLYGESRLKHAARINNLFTPGSFSILAPSKHVATKWKSIANLPYHDILILPHCVVVPTGQKLATNQGLEAGDATSTLTPIRVAFIGHPVSHKGWGTFCELVRRFSCDARYEFWHLGTPSSDIQPIKFVDVRASAGRPDAMIRAAEDCSIDVAMQWSEWPETFGISARECYAAGALIITNPGAGAISDFVEEAGAGLTVKDHTALYELFSGDVLYKQVMARNVDGAPLGDLQWSAFTLSTIKQLNHPESTHATTL